MVTASERRQLIVVGVRGSAGSVAALRWAATEAELREARLHVVRAWEDQACRLAPYAHLFAPVGCDDRATAQAQLQAVMQAVFGGPLPARVTLEIAEGLPARVLLDRAAGAGLLVLGSAMNPGFTGIGPVAQACLRHAPCPVTVVTGQASREPCGQWHLARPPHHQSPLPPGTCRRSTPTGQLR